MLQTQSQQQQHKDNNKYIYILLLTAAQTTSSNLHIIPGIIIKVLLLYMNILYEYFEVYCVLRSMIIHKYMYT